jgi:LAO/AO transport system kinase
MPNNFSNFSNFSNEIMDHPENSSEYAGLQVNSGVEQPSIINPYLKRQRVRRRELSAAEMVEGIIKGDVTILS